MTSAEEGQRGRAKGNTLTLRGFYETNIGDDAIWLRGGEDISGGEEGKQRPNRTIFPFLGSGHRELFPDHLSLSKFTGCYSGNRS